MVDPPAASLDFAAVGLAVKPPLSALAKFEMFDGVGDIGAGAIDTCFLQRGIENLARRTDEGPPRQIFLVAGLLTDEQYVGLQRALAEHGLGRIFIEVAARAVRCFVLQRLPRGGKVGGTARTFCHGPGSTLWPGLISRRAYALRRRPDFLAPVPCAARSSS
jgi:hypothetical protein